MSINTTPITPREAGRGKLIIGFLGPAKAGKGLATDVTGKVCSEKGIAFRKAAFGDPIKRIAMYVFGGEHDDYYTQAGKAKELPTTYGLTIRQVLQRIGTDMFRENIDEHVWVDFMINRNIAPEKPGTAIIVEDVRSATEIKAIQSCGGIVIGIIPAYDEWEGLDGAHPSEDIDYSLADFVIYNDRSENEFVGDISNITSMTLDILRGSSND